MSCGAAAVAATGASGQSLPGGWTRFPCRTDVCRAPVEPDVFLCYKNLWPGGTPGPPQDIRAPTRGPPDMVCPRKRVRSRDGMAAARDRRVPSLRGDAEQPGGQLVGERVLRCLEAALDTLPEPRLRGPSVGCSSRRRRRRRSPGVRGGTAPRQPLRETRGVWPRGVGWLSRPKGGRQGRRQRGPEPSSAAANAMAKHPRQRSGEPVRRASRSAVGGGMEASDAGPSMYPRSRSGD